MDFVEDSALAKLAVDIEHLPTSKAFLPWERELLGAIPKFLSNRARYQSWFEAETIADIDRVTGHSHDSVAAADEALKGVIAANDPARDKELVQIFHRRILRLSMIIDGTDPNDENLLFYKLDPILG